MLSGEFLRKIRRLNNKLNIFCSDNDLRPAGLFFMNRQNEFEEICGVDKNLIPKFPIKKDVGGIIKSGWMRVLKILIAKKFTNKQWAEKVFNCRLITNMKRHTLIINTHKPNIDKEMTKRLNKNMLDDGRPALKKDDVYELAYMVNKEKEDGK